MFQIPSFNIFPKLRRGSSHPTINLPPVEVHDVETSAEKPARALKHLLRLNHVKNSVLYHKLQFHNHMPHVCAPRTSPSLGRNTSRMWKSADYDH